MADQYLEDLARSLFKRRAEGVVIPFEPRATDLRLEPQDCHANVDAWCRFHPGHKACRGWFVIDQPAIRQTLFVSHSVIADEHGRRFDPTPRRFRNEYPFLEDDDPLYQLRNYYRNLRSVTHPY